MVRKNRRKTRTAAQKRATAKMLAARRKQLRGGRKTRRNAWAGHRKAHSAAAKKGWARRRRHGGGGRKKTRTAAQRRATAKMLAVRHGRRRVHARRHWKNPEAVAATPNKKRRRVKRRRVHANKAVATPNRRRRVSHRRRRAYANKAAAPNRRRRRRYAANQTLFANRKRRTHRRRHYKSNQTLFANRRKHGRRRYRRNPDIMGQLTSVFKVGATIAIGFLGHRAISTLVSDKLLGSIETFKSGKGLEWRGVVGGLLTAIVGIPVTNAALSKKPAMAAQIGAGMVVSLLHQALVSVLKAANQPEAAGYLAAYPNAEGHAYRSMSGYGAYELIPANGYGAYDYYSQYSGLGQPPHNVFPRLTQAVGGYGAAPMVPLTQAAAGMGANPIMPVERVTQAAAGYGYGAVPMVPLTQAAAGTGEYFLQPGQSGVGEYFAQMGEYFAQGVQGIGEYEGVEGYGHLGAATYTDEGIHPDLTSAERALTVAEAAAGIGDVPLQSTWVPDQIAAPILDAPGGSRAGILQGPDGIFG